MNTAATIVVSAFMGLGPLQDSSVVAPERQLAQPRRATEAAHADHALPSDAESAPKALMDSPRHGEWVDIALPESETKLKTWVVYPERKDEAPIVLVIHEIFGLTDWVRGVADQLAAEGFIAVAPDLLSGKGPDGGGTASFQGDAVREAIRKLSDDEVTQRLDAARAWAIALPASSDRTATIGFCWGGSTSFTYATRQPKLNAAIVYYGSAPTEHEQLAKIDAPVLGLYGGDDARITSTVDATASLMKELSKDFEHHVYDGAGHGFLRQRSGDRAEANTRAARQAWNETIAFLIEHAEREGS